MVCHKCPTCEIEFDKKSRLVEHINKKFKCKPIIVNELNSFQNIPFNVIKEYVYKNINQSVIDNPLNVNLFSCEFCNKSYSTKSNLCKHLNTNCKVKKKQEDEKVIKENEIKSENEYLKNQIDKIIQFNDNLIKQNKKNEKVICELKNKLVNLTENSKSKEFNIINDNIKKLEKTFPVNSNLEISNQLVNKIIEKEKKIDELNLINNLLYDNTIQKIKCKITMVDDNIYKQSINNEIENKSMNLILNNQIIQFRETDNYINAAQLCKAGEKIFGHWYCLKETKELINVLASDSGISILQLIDSKKGNSTNYIEGIWVHPDLGIQLAQWVSPGFSIQVSCWIKELFTKGNVNVNLKILKEKENIIKDNNRRIKILENLSLKRHKRTKYHEYNVVYIVKDPENKNDRKYVIGKAKDLTNRLSTYNKGSEFDVIYYKGFETEKQMEKAEGIVLLKLSKYQEKANRDRFILPAGEDIKLFTSVIDEAWKFFN